MESLEKEGTSWGENVRIDSGETVFKERNVKNTTLRSRADWGIRDVEIEEPGKKASWTPGSVVVLLQLFQT